VCCIGKAPRGKCLNSILSVFYGKIKATEPEACPEAMGINITATMAQAGIMLEWPPESVTYQIALAGIRLP